MIKAVFFDLFFTLIYPQYTDVNEKQLDTRYHTVIWCLVFLYDNYVKKTMKL
jgi:hypothetical protein